MAGNRPVTVITEEVPVVVASVPMSRLPLDKVSWTWSLALLGVMALGFLILLFAPDRRTPEEPVDPVGATDPEPVSSSQP